MDDDYVAGHLRNLYGMNPDIPHMAFQFPRLPPSLVRPAFKIHGNPSRERLARDAETVNKKLQGFQQMYQKHASGLFTMGSAVIPPGHPLYTGRDSAGALKAENDRLLKENSELRKRLERKSREQ